MKLKSMVVVGVSFLLLPHVASAEILSVKGASANFREKPSETAKLKFSADQFYPVEVLETKNGWAKIRDFEGEEAWVAERLLAKQPSVVISADKANIRSAPNTTSPVVFKVERGEVFKIVDRKNLQKSEWIKVIDAKGEGGWIRDDMTWGEGAPVLEKLEKLDEKPGPAAEAPAKAKGAEEHKPAQPVTVEASKDGVKVEAKAPQSITQPEALEALCRAYLDEPPQVTIAAPAPKSEKPAAKPEKADKPAAKPTTKPAAKPATKPAAKPAAKPAQKKK
ncbi:MAG: SH3 domain-containing protein [Polyangiaceae bacterium]|nr:SH3 domain-containing protein [Polyangiaceae bacterium]MBK8937432.1 SH3 domain-containing protein [Polyangiaceae bacterium]